MVFEMRSDRRSRRSCICYDLLETQDFHCNLINRSLYFIYFRNNQKNIPFRDSKLTRLFQGFFCGKGKASMIVNVNQCASAFDETLHALKFSAIAKKVIFVNRNAENHLASIQWVRDGCKFGYLFKFWKVR